MPLSRLGSGRAELFLLMAILLALAGWLIWKSQERVGEFKARQQAHAALLADSTARQIASALDGLNRTIALFTAKEATLLAALARDPENEALFQRLEAQVHADFPDAFAVTLADANGQPMHTDFDGLIGEACQADLNRFAQMPRHHEIYIHPHADSYHIDMMAQVSQSDGQTRIFFISLKAGFLSGILRNNRLYDHEPILLRSDTEDLIEVTADGVRNTLQRHFRLSPEELRQIQAKAAVPGTRWQVVILPDTRVSARYAREVWTETGLTLGVLALFSVLVFWQGFRGQRLRAAYTRHLEQTSAQLEEQAARTQAILDTAADGILTLDASGRIESFNRAAEQIFGYSEAEVRGQDIRQLLPGAFAGQAVGAVSRQELSARRRDGGRLPVEISVSELQLGARRLYTVLIRDIAAHKAAEQALIAARDEAEQASRAKSEFLANMSHEIRTPMNGVLGMVRLALETPLNPQQREYLTLVNQSAEHLLVIINDILDFSRIEAGKLAITPEPFDLNALLQQTVQALEFRAEEKGLALSLAIAPGVPGWITADGTRLHQILVNLIGNAIKFTERGSVSVRVDLEAGEPDQLHICVADTGIGIDPDKLAHIFDAFTQADTWITKRFGGTGLGLAICKRLLDLMGGRIRVESEPGAGSRFHVLLPYEPAQATAAPEPPAPTPAPTAKPASLRILLAEDNAINQKLAVKLLEKHGHQVRVTGDGEQALAAWRAGAFDLILMDVMMPVMDGLTATRRLRGEEAARGGHIPIIAMTANAMQGDREKCLEAGMDGYVSKPILADILQAEIERILMTRPPTTS